MDVVAVPPLRLLSILSDPSPLSTLALPLPLLLALLPLLPPSIMFIPYTNISSRKLLQHSTLIRPKKFQLCNRDRLGRNRPPLSGSRVPYGPLRAPRRQTRLVISTRGWTIRD
ncbi:hypothetical protein RJ55_00084 [Drechmeria coniospora]|nr:hypothetical protein RJ55_00084 [Drechmeria coniospora]